MRTSFHKTFSFLKYLVIFLFGISAIYFAAAYTNINTTLSNATQYIQKIILTNDGNQSGTTGIILDGNQGSLEVQSWIKTRDVLLSGVLAASGDIYTNHGDIRSNNGKLKGQNLEIGPNTTAYGYGSTAMGDGTIASGDYSTAMGNGTIASDSGSTAMGKFSRAYGYISTAIGFSTIASGRISVAMGNQTVAIGANSTAMGLGTQAIGANSTAIGDFSIANGISSISMGIGTITNSSGATAIGTYNIGLSDSIFEIGIGSQGSPLNAVTVLANGNVGIGTSTPTQALMVNGIVLTNSSIFSAGFISRGIGVSANGNLSTAMGQGTTANGNYSTAMGRNTQALGNHSTALGYSTIASGDSSTAIGSYTISNGDYSTVLGKYNIGLSNSIFEIGIGSAGSPLNALTVLNNGKVGVGTTTPNALLTVEGAIRAIKLTSDPCTNTEDYPEGGLFYNDTSDYYCFCNGSQLAKKMSDEVINCF